MKKVVTKLMFTIIFVVFTLLVLSTQNENNTILAACSTYFPYADPPCVDNDYNAIEPHVQCKQNPYTCCNTQLECDEKFDPPPSPVPSGYPSSTANCGVWSFDPGLGRKVCFDTEYKELVGAITCPRQSQCCKYESLCTRYFSCDEDLGSCYEDSKFGIYDEEGCWSNCKKGEPGEASKLFCPNGELNTAIGCIPINDTDELLGFILRWAIGIGGGIAFLLIIFAGFQIMTSAGNPERLQAGRELLTSAIAGLILLVFSVFILRIIGVDILNLPGFGG